MSDKIPNLSSAKAIFKSQKALLDQVGQHNIKKIIDIGCGHGLQSSWFAQHSINTTAVDHIINLNLQQRSQKFGFDTKQVDIHRLPYTDNLFDAAWSSHVLEHSLNPYAALLEWRRVIKPDGYLFITVPEYKNQVVLGHQFTGWNIGQLMYFLAIAGFNIKKGKYRKWGHHIQAIVQKGNTIPPDDNWQLLYLLDNNALPDQIQKAIQANRSRSDDIQFKGNLNHINWPFTWPEKIRLYINRYKL